MDTSMLHLKLVKLDVKKLDTKFVHQYSVDFTGHTGINIIDVIIKTFLAKFKFKLKEMVN